MLKTKSSSSKLHNVFDNLPSLSVPTQKKYCDELDQYLGSDIEVVDDALAWWYEWQDMYPHLSRMALDHLTIPGEWFAYAWES